MDRMEKGHGPGRLRKALPAAPFVALAIFKIWASLGQSAGALLLAALAMLAVCVLILVVAFRLEGPSYFDWAVTAFFAVISVSLAVAPRMTGAFLYRYPVTGIYTVLFAAAFFPPLLGFDPFTYRYAKKRAPREFWDHPFFISINRIMTYVWAGIFFICLLLSLYPSMITRVIAPLVIILGIGFPFNKRFPDYYLKRQGLPPTRSGSAQQ